jgi:hypothetical protein
MNYNFATHATCSLALIVYKYNKLQFSFTIQKLSCKASYKTPFLLIVVCVVPLRLMMIDIYIRKFHTSFIYFAHIFWSSET